MRWGGGVEAQERTGGGEGGGREGGGGQRGRVGGFIQEEEGEDQDVPGSEARHLEGPGGAGGSSGQGHIQG